MSMAPDLNGISMIFVQKPIGGAVLGASAEMEASSWNRKAWTREHYHVVYEGRENGTNDSWEAASHQVLGHPGNVFKCI